MMSVRVNDVPYQWKVEATAGVDLLADSRWFGSRISYRAGTSGRWLHLTLVDVHPFNTATLERVLRRHLERDGAS